MYGNRRRVGGEQGKALLRRRGELLERSFAHAYETGGMRRLHLRGQDNVLKWVLIHLGGFNLSLMMRQLLGKGTPRGLQDLSAERLLMLLRRWIAVWVRQGSGNRNEAYVVPSLRALKFSWRQNGQPTFTTGC